MAIPQRPKLKTAFKNARSIKPLDISGLVALATDGKRLITCVNEDILLTDVEHGLEICRFQSDSEAITALCISKSSRYLTVFTASLALRIYELPTTVGTSSRPVQPLRVVHRAHDAPVHTCKVDPTSTYLASGSADGIVKVWDITRGYVTHIFKGHGGVVSALAFSYIDDPSSVTKSASMKLFTASVDTRIRIFDLSANSSKYSGAMKPEHVLDGHTSVPRGLDVSLDGKWLLSGGRDSVVLIHNLMPQSPGDTKGKGKAQPVKPMLSKTIPVQERVEAAGFIPDSSGSSDLCFYTGGQGGLIKVWDARKGKILSSLGQSRESASEEEEEQRQILNVLYNPTTASIVSVHADQNIMFYDLSTRALTRQLIGFNDEIVDTSFLSSLSSSPDSHIAFATNSSLIRVYSTTSLDARLLEGHTDIVLCLDSAADGRLLVSGSKDHSARLWGYNPDGSWNFGCVAICEGHAESVGAVAMSRNPAGAEDSSFTRFMFTGSQDRTIKMWDLDNIPLQHQSDGDVRKCRSLVTHKAHEKDINSLDVAPGDRLLVSGSQDRSAKIFEIQYVPGHKGKATSGQLKLLGTCKGHKRGVWTVKFSRTERILATGSGDKTVKLWNLEDFSCIKTFEGHTNSVLRVDFLTAGLQLASSASDGLVKIWNVKDEECVATLDNHEDKVWALAISRDEQTIVSGAADSVVTFWEDSTEEEEADKESKRTELVLKEQDFLNYVSLNDYKRAIQLALDMKQPGRLFSLFKNIHSSAGAEIRRNVTGSSAVDEVVRTLAGSSLVQLLQYVKEWNANAKSSVIAQSILHAVLKLRNVADVMKAFDDANAEASFANGQILANGASSNRGSGSTELKELIEALIPYTERHLARMERLVQDSYMVDYILSEMDDGMFVESDDESRMAI